MKKVICAVLLAGSIFPQISLACDDILKPPPGQRSLLYSKDFNYDSFARDCAIQDRYREITNSLAKFGINVEDITRYKALRFINESDYQRNLAGSQKPLEQIYDPAPVTWNIWEDGITSVLKKYGQPGVLLQKNTLDAAAIADINKLLMMEDGVSLKDSKISSTRSPGTYRTYTDNSAGYCSLDPNELSRSDLDTAIGTNLEFQDRFETAIGTKFKNFVAFKGGKWPEMASMNAGIDIRRNACGKDLNFDFVTYTPGNMVEYQVDWTRIFIEEVLASYRRKKPLLAPTEFSALIQRWIVSIHPFVDGNGRTSRGVQDVITHSFKLPYVPAGSLQNDALSSLWYYTENTYGEVEKMMTFLEGCVDSYERGGQISYDCKVSK